MIAISYVMKNNDRHGQQNLAEPEYISVNRTAYDRLADEYRARASPDRLKDVPIITPFADYLMKTFGKSARVLDLGQGNGVNLAMFHDLGFRVSGIDISPRMLAVAREICPAADLRCGDFLTSAYASESFEGIFSKASIHLFPKADAVRAIRKAFELLVPRGMFYVTTTVADAAGEGYRRKEDYRQRPVRFRKDWTPQELSSAVTDSGFSIFKASTNFESHWDKQWFNVWAVK